MFQELRRVRLQTLARVLSERGKLTLAFGKSSKTDLKNIELSQIEGEIIPGVPASRAECWVAQKALCAHESGHIKFSAKNVMERAQVTGGRALGFLLNVIEDARIERCMANDYPGTTEWFRFYNDYHFTKTPDWGAGPEALIRGLTVYAVTGRIPDPVSEHEDVMDLLRRCAPIIDRGRIGTDTEAAYECALEIYEIVKDFLTGSETPDISMPGTYRPARAPGGTLDPRREPRLPDKEESPPEKVEGPEEPGEVESTAQPREESEERPEEIQEDSDPGERPEAPEAQEDAPVQVDGEEDCREDPGESEDHGADSQDYGVDQGEDPAEVPECAFDDSGGDEENPDEKDPEDDGFFDEDPGEEGFGEPFPDEEDETDFLDEEDPEHGPGEEEVSPEGEETSPDEIELSAYDGLLKSADDELESLEAGSARAEKKDLELPDISESEVEDELSAGIHDGIEFRLDKIIPVDGDRKIYDLIYRAARPYITKTTEEIRKILEYRAAMLERNLRRGRLDSGALWKLETGDCKMFCRLSQPDDVPRMAIYLLADCSGSMIYGDRMAGAREAAVLMCEVCAALKIPVCVTGYTGAVEHEGDVVHRRVLAFDNPPDRKYAVAGLGAEKENRDGYSIRVAARELALRPEPKKVLMVLSDGLPEMPYLDYDGPPAVRDTALAVREAEKSGLGVIGFYFGDKATLPQAQMIYTNLIYVQDVSVLPQAVARTLKKVMSNL